ncbi:hypothetical protein S7335_2626 [Synechococcus sp. PCC 7335]|nr:hypothetical protein S7335_2626 [Synechococcus sp. PCC 7335]
MDHTSSYQILFDWLLGKSSSIDLIALKQVFMVRFNGLK